MISKNKLFIFFSISFLIWIFLNNIFNIIISLLILLTIVIFFFIYYLFYKKLKLFLIIMCYWFIFWVFISYYNLSIINNNELLLKSYFNSKKHNLDIEIIDVYKINDYNNDYLAKLNNIDWKKINKKIRLIFSVPSNFTLKKWFILNINEKIYEQKNSNDFQYKNYLLTKNIYFKVYSSKYSIIQKKELNFITKNILLLKENIIFVINKLYPKNEALFLWWILIWERKNLPEELKNNFNNSWLTHLIAVSWFNITILIIFLWYIFKFLPVFFRTIIITLSIIFFTIIVWDSASVIRASIMWLIWYYILISWRKWENLSIILFTLLIMTCFSPLSLNYDISLHLSFLALLWIIYTQDFFWKIFKKIPDFLEIKQAFILTLSSLVFTLPIIVLNFWQLSILSPFANIAVTWTIPFAMLFWFLSIIVYFVNNIFWYIIWYFAWIFLKWDIIIIQFFWKQNWAILKFDPWIYKIHIELLYFMILVFFIIWFRKKET